MANLGQPFVIQNTDGPTWFVTWRDAVETPAGETVSFTVEIPRSANLTLGEAQRFAMKRAAELLQIAIRGTSDQ
ncbi:hypothetical protein [Paracidovorax avenae]|uniref:hypothetical protein n=1 Tax=Paracidovorax avenae TaxID=80867 RepID=UPI001314917F|nr:hypothetical protein [Paracidovorax avenae]